MGMDMDRDMDVDMDIDMNRMAAIELAADAGDYNTWALITRYGCSYYQLVDGPGSRRRGQPTCISSPCGGIQSHSPCWRARTRQPPDPTGPLRALALLQHWCQSTPAPDNQLLSPCLASSGRVDDHVPSSRDAHGLPSRHHPAEDLYAAVALRRPRLSTLKHTPTHTTHAVKSICKQPSFLAAAAAMSVRDG